jgi:UPF0176 protein
MRNHYESEIGRFEKAFIPNAGTFKETIQIVADTLKNQKDKKIVLYCTGGIRCEKASSYLIKNGFSDVNQLQGGIVQYAHYVKVENVPSKFKGKNFVFDNRLGERIDELVISTCHQCGNSCDSHTNCENNDCHKLIIQCTQCAKKFDGCCCDDCKNIRSLPIEEKKKLRSVYQEKYARSKIFLKSNGKVGNMENL